MKELTGVDDVVAIVDDGSPHGSRLFALWNPPLHQPVPVKEPGRLKKSGSSDHRRNHKLQATEASAHWQTYAFHYMVNA